MNIFDDFEKDFYKIKAQMKKEGIPDVEIDHALQMYIQVSTGVGEYTANKTINNLTAFIEKQVSLGMTEEQIADYVADDFATDGALWQEFTKSLENGAREMTDIPTSMIFEEAENMTWISVGDERVCEDCAKLHGTTREISEWMTEFPYGLANNGKTLCNEVGRGIQCRCMMVPVKTYNDNKEDLNTPITMNE